MNPSTMTLPLSATLNCKNSKIVFHFLKFGDSKDDYMDLVELSVELYFKTGADEFHLMMWPELVEQNTLEWFEEFMTDLVTDRRDLAKQRLPLDKPISFITEEYKFCMTVLALSKTDVRVTVDIEPDDNKSMRVGLSDNISIPSCETFLHEYKSIVEFINTKIASYQWEDPNTGSL